MLTLATSTIDEHADLTRWLSWMWCFGVLFTIGRDARFSIALVGVRRRSRALPVAELHRWGHGPLVVTSEEVDLPFTTGLVNPTIVVPADSRHWTSHQWHAVLAHERAHIERADAWYLAMARFAVAMHWFNPLIRRVANEASAASELACDEAVLRDGLDPHVYATILVDFAAGAKALPRLALGLADGSAIARRVHAMLAPPMSRRDARRRDRWLPGSAVVGVVALSVVVVSRLPARASSRAELLPSTRPATNVSVVPRSTTQDVRGLRVPTTDARTAALLGLATALSDENAHVRDAAARALRSWPKADAVARLSPSQRPEAGMALNLIALPP